MNYTYTKTLHVEDTVYDVLVAGGGPAGYSAAISAARLGAHVLLVEADGTLGGMATGGLVTRFDTTSDGERMIVGGVMREVLEKLYARGGISHYYSFDRFTCQRGKYTPFNPEALKLLLDEMVTDSGAEIRFFTKIVDAIVSDRKHIEGVIVADVEGLHMIRARTYIDATGDAILAEAAGAECMRAGTPAFPGIMPPTLCSFFSNIDWNRIPLNDKSPVKHGEMLKKALADGFFSQPDTFIPGIARNCSDTGGMNAGHIFGMDAVDARSLSDGMIKGRQQVQEYAAYYRKYVPGFADMELVMTGPKMGVRESRRIVGEYMLSTQDYLSRRQFDDQIGIYSKTPDTHPYDLSEEAELKRRKEAKELVRFEDGESYGLPYGMIVPKGFDNLWAAGRCSSSDRLVNGAVRVQPAAAILGQAAGTAAWQCCRDGLPANNPNIGAIRIALEKSGAVLK